MVDFQSQSSFAPWPGVAVFCRLEKDRKMFLESNRLTIYLVEYLKSCGFAIHSHCIQHMLFSKPGSEKDLFAPFSANTGQYQISIERTLE